MDVIKKIVNDTPGVREEVINKFKLVDISNLKTTKQIAKDAIAQDIQKSHMLRICGEEMEEMQNEINTKDIIINKYEEVIGDDKINSEIMWKVNTEKLDIFNNNSTRKQISERLLKRTKTYIEGYNKKLYFIKSFIKL